MFFLNPWNKEISSTFRANKADEYKNLVEPFHVINIKQLPYKYLTAVILK